METPKPINLSEFMKVEMPHYDLSRGIKVYDSISPAYASSKINYKFGNDFRRYA